jgi:hypothetical protein
LIGEGEKDLKFFFGKNIVGRTINISEGIQWMKKEVESQGKG